MAFTAHKSATHWKEKENTLIFAWTAGPGLTPFVTPIGPEQAASIAQEWLSANSEWPEEPGYDGDNGKSQRVFSDDWGHVDDDWRCFVGIQPMWEIYGK